MTKNLKQFYRLKNGRDRHVRRRDAALCTTRVAAEQLKTEVTQMKILRSSDYLRANPSAEPTIIISTTTVLPAADNAFVTQAHYCTGHIKLRT